MRKVSTALVAVLALSSCGVEDAGSGETGETPDMMAAALVQLVTEDHTFGDGPPPFSVLLVQSDTDPSAGNPTATGSSEARKLTRAERSKIEDALSEFGEVRWIDDPDEWRTDDLTPEVEGSAILGVGEPVVEDDSGLVPVSLWCGGLCGTWLTYRLDLAEGEWTVVGIEGPVAIS